MGHHKRRRSVHRGTLAGIRQVLFAHKPPSRNLPRRSRDLGNLLGVGVLLAALPLSAVIARLHSNHQRRPTTAAVEMPFPDTPDVTWDATWPQLLLTGIPSRPLDQIRAAYAFAARRPDVLREIPCFCGCARQGHQSNEACYVRARLATGAPRWTDHAITCGMCVDITREAAAMTAKKQTPTVIRQRVDAKYRDR